MSILELPDPDVRALVIGELVVGFAPRGRVEVGDEVELTGTGGRPAGELKPAYRHWAELGPPAGTWTAVVESVHPTAVLDPDSGHSRHLLAAVPDGDLIVLRVYSPDGPVLSDTAFAARLRSLRQSL